MSRVQVPEQLVLPDGKQWFSLSEVAKAVGRHKLTVYRWEHEGLIPQPQRIPIGLRAKVSMRRYSREEVQAIWSKMTQAA